MVRSPASVFTKLLRCNMSTLCVIIGMLLISFPASVSGVVVDVTSDNLFQTFFGGYRMFVLFHHPDCKSCTTIKKDFEVAAKNIIPPYPVLVAVVNCGTFEALCLNQGVVGYPTIMHYGDQGGPGNGTSYKGDKMPWAYETFLEKTYRDCNILDESDPGCTPVVSCVKYICPLQLVAL
jgi:hypothetical protein